MSRLMVEPLDDNSVTIVSDGCARTVTLSLNDEGGGSVEFSTSEALKVADALRYAVDSLPQAEQAAGQAAKVEQLAEAALQLATTPANIVQEDDHAAKF